MKKPRLDKLQTLLAQRGLRYEGELLARERKSRGLTQHQLAEMSGDRAADISNMEHDRVRVQRRVWIALGIDPDTLPAIENPAIREVLVRLHDSAAREYESWPERVRCDRLSNLVVSFREK